MRKGLFAIVLIAAAFAGGAAVNGPGLRWAKEFIWSKMPTEGENEDPSDLVQPSVGPVVASDDGPDSVPGQEEKVEAETPTAKDPPLKELAKSSAPGPTAPEPSELQSAARAELKNLDSSTATSGRNPAADLDELPPLSVPRAGSDAPPELLPPTSAPVAESPAPATLPLLLEQTPSSSLTKVAANKGLTKREDHAWSDAPGSAPAAAVPPRPYTSRPDRDSSASTASTPANNTTTIAAATRVLSDWNEVRQKMRALGVSRYGIDGEPGGRVRFHCIIPLAGKRAVSQHFEAEGDDELQAAAATLRRVTLWRATENTSR